MNTLRRSSIACRICLLSIGWALALPADGSSSGRTPPRSTARLLVDLARDYGLNRRGKQTAADVLHIKTLLRAAVRLDPNLSDPYDWLYELALLSGDREEAARLLDEWVAADAAHAGVFVRWLESRLARLQTAEERRSWLEALLDRPRADRLQSLIHVYLARLAHHSMDDARCRRHLAQAERLHPLNPDLPVLELEAVTDDAPPEQRLRLALRALEVNPLRVELSWQIGLLLDEHGFAREAYSFYEHALSVQRSGGAARAVPAEYLLQLARNALSRGQPKAALDFARGAVTSEPRFTEAALFFEWAVSRYGDPKQAEDARRQLGRRFARIKEPAEWPVNELAQAAWFYCTSDPQPQRALMLAEAAAQRAPRDSFVTRALGWAQALNLRPDDAKQTLAPIADRDPCAAYRLAKLLREDDDADAAERVLRDLVHVPRSGPAYEMLAELGASGPATQPAARRFPKVAQALSGFDREVLEFAKEPSRFLKADVRLEDVSPAPGEPWWAVFSLTNKSRFPITLGPDRMVNPVFVLSFRVEGDRRRAYPDLMTVNLDRVRVIPPGETVRLRRTIDVGPLRRMTRQTPQQLQRVTVSAILDAVQTAGGEWRSGLAGQMLPPVNFNRLPAGTDLHSFHALFSALRGDSAAGRFRALEVMAELLGEQQRAATRKLRYRPEPIPTKRVYQALLSALAGKSWETRARVLDSLQVAGLNARMVAAAEVCLDHPHWLVRLMAVRLLARQGRGFAQTARDIAANDQDPLVRDIAQSYVDRWMRAQEPPSTTQPAAETRQTPAGGG